MTQTTPVASIPIPLILGVSPAASPSRPNEPTPAPELAVDLLDPEVQGVSHEKEVIRRGDGRREVELAAGLSHDGPRSPWSRRLSETRSRGTPSRERRDRSPSRQPPSASRAPRRSSRASKGRPRRRTPAPPPARSPRDRPGSRQLPPDLRAGRPGSSSRDRPPRSRRGVPRPGRSRRDRHRSRPRRRVARTAGWPRGPRGRPGGFVPCRCPDPSPRRVRDGPAAPRAAPARPAREPSRSPP